MKDNYNIENFDAFLNYIEENKKHLSIIMAIKDTPGSNMDKDILVRLQALGFISFYTELWRMYIGIIDRGNLLIDKRAPQKEDTITHSVVIDNKKVDIESSSWRRKNIASIRIDQIEYAVNMRGVNIVVYDYDVQRVIMSVGYDHHDKTARFNNKSLNRQEELKKWKEDNNFYDVCFVSAFDGINYGSIFNAYAEYRVLKAMGKKVIMIPALNFPLKNIEEHKKYNVKFIEQYYENEEIGPNLANTELDILNACSDTFVVGSDQLWNWHVSFGGKMYLPFVQDDKFMFSFATSLGALDDHVPKGQRRFVRNCLSRFDAISVREEFSKEILRKKYGIYADRIIEPVFWLEKADYINLADDSEYVTPNSYILAYILDPTKEKLEYLERVGRKLGLPVVTIPDAAYKILPSSWGRCEYADHFPNLIMEMEVVDFLKLYADASFVVTDSFHGTAFSIIFEKKFISICNLIRGKDRFLDMLGRFDLMERLLYEGNLVWKEDYINDIDFEKIHSMLSQERILAIEWVHKAFLTPKKNKHIGKVEKECIGCGACASICPADAIEMVYGQYGYYQPKVNANKCLDCSKCKMVCPALKAPINENTIKPDLYEFQCGDTQTLMTSTSGGVFLSIAERFIESGGAVYGVAWNENFLAQHIRVSNSKDLCKLQKSKYMQSYTGNIFQLVKDDVEEGYPVLFSGCPCQIAGLKNYLGTNYENLLLIDLLCGNAPSSEFFQMYLKDDCPNNLKNYEFRTKIIDKNVDAETITMTLSDDRKIVRHGVKEDAYQKAYHPHFMCAEHCEHCKYQRFPRLGDLTIGDFWWLKEKDITISCEKGVSAVLINNSKGEKIIKELDNGANLIKAVPLDWLGGNGFTTCNNWSNKGRDVFYDAILTHSFTDALKIASKEAIKK